MRNGHNAQLFVVTHLSSYKYFIKEGGSDLSVKTYLQEQIRLVSLSSYDLFTEEEHELYMKIIEQKNELDKLD